MIDPRRFGIEVGVLIGVLVLSAAPGTAQPARTRSLAYDPDRRDWVEQPPPTPGTAEADLHEIKITLKGGEYRRARSAVKRFIKRYGRDHPLYPEAQIVKAKALIGCRAFYKAHLTLQEFLDRFGHGPLKSEAQRLEYVIAETFLTGVKRKIWGLRLLPTEDTALEVLDELSADERDGRWAELALKTKGDYLFSRGEHMLAELEYTRLARVFPQGRYHQDALRRSADAALASFGGVEYDEAALIEADERFADYRRFYPTGSDREEVDLILGDVQEKRAQKEFVIGQYYERTGHVSSAIYYYQLVRSDWPDSVAATKALARLELLGVMQATP